MSETRPTRGQNSRCQRQPGGMPDQHRLRECRLSRGRRSGRVAHRSHQPGHLRDGLAATSVTEQRRGQVNGPTSGPAHHRCGERFAGNAHCPGSHEEARQHVVAGRGQPRARSQECVSEPVSLRYGVSVPRQCFEQGRVVLAKDRAARRAVTCSTARGSGTRPAGGRRTGFVPAGPSRPRPTPGTRRPGPGLATGPGSARCSGRR